MKSPIILNSGEHQGGSTPPIIAQLQASMEAAGARESAVTPQQIAESLGIQEPESSMLARIQETVRQNGDPELAQLMQDIANLDGPGVSPETQDAFDRAKQRGWK